MGWCGSLLLLLRSLFLEKKQYCIRLKIRAEQSGLGLCVIYLKGQIGRFYSFRYGDQLNKEGNSDILVGNGEIPNRGMLKDKEEKYSAVDREILSNMSKIRKLSLK